MDTNHTRDTEQRTHVRPGNRPAEQLAQRAPWTIAAASRVRACRSSSAAGALVMRIKRDLDPDQPPIARPRSAAAAPQPGPDSSLGSTKPAIAPDTRILRTIAIISLIDDLDHLVR